MTELLDATNVKLPFGQHKHLVYVSAVRMLRCQRCGGQEEIRARRKGETGAVFACVVGEAMEGFEEKHGGCERGKKGKAE
jgi:hypothetical protein